MKKQRPINEKEPVPNGLDRLHRMLEVPFSKGKEEVWKAMQEKMTAEETVIRRAWPYRNTLWRAAAVFAALISLAALLRFYPDTIRTAPGQTASFTLPDGSSVMLNAESQLTYYPLWWKIAPKISLNGEAFFTGHHRRRFTVRSKLGTVTVLGTSFDVYARPGFYRVVCFTGKVNVTSRTQNSLVLNPGEKAEITPAGEITFSKAINTQDFKAWTRGQFVFTAAPLSSVFAELARRYHVRILLQKNIASGYTGNFSASLPVEEALNIVCKPFGLTFVKKDNGVYVVR